MRQVVAVLLCAFSIVLAAASDAGAVSSAWDRNDQAAVRLVSAVAASGELNELPLGLQIQLEKGWKTYWRTPGSGALPPQIDWSGSENLAGVDLLWPAPTRSNILGIDTIGYAGEVVLPLTVRPKVTGKPIRLKGRVDYLTCEEICVPQTALLELAIPAGRPTPTNYTHLIDSYRGRVPGPPSAALAIRSAELVSAGRNAILKLTVVADRPIPGADIFVDTAARLEFGRATVVSQPDGRFVEFSVPVTQAGDKPDALLSARPTIVLTAGDRAVEQRLDVVVAQPKVAEAGPGLAAVLMIALLGGLILNLMPCVLPVLSLKLLGVIAHGGTSSSAARRSFLATSAGILTSFLLLAGAAIAVQAAGLAVGWGIQFQQPLFLAGMALLLLLFTANLWGLFEIGLPAWAGSLGARTAHGNSFAGSFVTGVLATLLATPCSAPFVGTAVAFAFSRGAPEIVAVFAALGLGLALPYLLVAAFPRLVTWLPRPGAWMIQVRRVLGLLLAVTAVWLLTILAGQTDWPAAALVAVAAVALTAVAAMPLKPVMRWSMAVPLAVAALAAPTLMVGGAPAVVIQDTRWAVFEQGRIQDLVSAGETVFVDVTADWCITCKVNKAAVLEVDPVAGRLQGPGIVTMRADWTRPNEEIARYLAGLADTGFHSTSSTGPALRWESPCRSC